MENNEKMKSSRPVSLLLLIPAFLFGLVSIVLAIVGFGLIPLLPAAIGLILGLLSFFIFRNSFKVFTMIILGIVIAAILISLARSTFFKSKVAADETFDSTLVITEESINADLEGLFEDLDMEEIQADSLVTE